jgi:hypothetical protein
MITAAISGLAEVLAKQTGPAPALDGYSGFFVNFPFGAFKNAFVFMFPSSSRRIPKLSPFIFYKKNFLRPLVVSYCPRKKSYGRVSASLPAM